MLETIKRIFYPKRCSLCKEIIPINQKECNCQKDEFRSYGLNFCNSCGGEKGACRCHEAGNIRLENVTAPYVYTDRARRMITRLKFHGEKDYADFFSLKMSIHFAMAYPFAEPDLITFVPITKARKKERGYNQSELMAQGIGKRLLIPCVDVLEKTKETPPQHTLTLKERKENLVDVFFVTNEEAVRNKTVILCDDVKTTGVTLMRCCEELYKAGAKEIFCLCATVSDYSDPFSLDNRK